MEDKTKLIKIYKYCCDICDNMNEMTIDKFIQDNRVITSCAFNLLQIGEIAGTIQDVTVKEALKSINFDTNEFHHLRSLLIFNYDTIGGQHIYKMCRIRIPLVKTKLLKLAVSLNTAIT